jgi:hypothetical protein
VVGLLLALTREARGWERTGAGRARTVGEQLGAVIDALAYTPSLVALP